MRLISLRLEQWRSFEDCTIEFPDGLIGVRGTNGAGKSTIAEAIGWALFGKLRSRAKVGDLRRQGAPTTARSCVTLQFQLGTSEYLVERLVRGDARFSINGQLETDKSQATNARIAQELDLTWEVFHRTVFAQQKDVAALDANAPAEQRKSHVERLLGLERFKLAAARARSEAKTRTSELAGLRQLAPDATELAAQLAEAEAKAADGDPAVEAAQDVLDRATAARGDAQTALEKERDRVTESKLLVERRDARQKAVGDSEAELAAAKGRLDERAADAKRLTEIEAQASTFSGLASALPKWDELKEASVELEATNTALGSLGFDDGAAKADGDKLAALIGERTKLTEERAAADSTHERAAARAGALTAIATAGSPGERRVAVGELETELEAVRRRLTILRSELDHDRAHVDEVEKGGPDTPCPTCRKPYGAEYADIVAGYRSRIAANDGEIPGLEKSSAEIAARLEGARAAVGIAERAEEAFAATSGADKIDAADAAVLAAEAEIARIDRRLEDLAAEVPALEASCAKHTISRTMWQGLDATRTAQAERVDRATASLGVERYDADAHEHLRNERERVAPLSEEATRLKDALASVPHLEEQAGKAEARLEAAKEELEATESTLASLELDAELFATLEQRLAECEAARDVAQTKLTATKLEAQSRSQEVIELRRRVVEATEAQKTIDAKATDLRQHEVAAELLSKYREMQARRAWPRLEQVASALLSATTNGRYADVKLSEDFRLSVVDRDEEHELTRFSGGEQDLVNLCLRLAIADWVSKERNVDLGFVILDEVFGSQDEERRQRLLGELRALGNRFRQMLVITHLPEIADLCDEQLEVTLLEEGKSTASLLG